MKTLKPFHESIIDAINRCGYGTIRFLAEVITKTAVPENHDAIIDAWVAKAAIMRFAPHYQVTESLLAQKKALENGAKIEQKPFHESIVEILTKNEPALDWLVWLIEKTIIPKNHNKIISVLERNKKFILDPRYTKTINSLRFQQRESIEKITVVLKALDGSRSIRNSKSVFTGGIDGVFSHVDPKAGAQTQQTKLSFSAALGAGIGTFADLSADLEEIYLSQHQIVELYESHIDAIKDLRLLIFIKKNEFKKNDENNLKDNTALVFVDMEGDEPYIYLYDLTLSSLQEILGQCAFVCPQFVTAE
jgi:hypothetical protein